MINFFKNLFAPKRVKIPPLEKVERPQVKDSINKRVLLKAISQIGVGEIAGKKSNKQIENYHRYSTIKNDRGMNESVPWCASFVCWVLEVCSLESTNSKLARSYEKWGVWVTDVPLPGDVVTFWRKSKRSGYGHVGFYFRQDDKYVWVLGGNQNNEVNVTKYRKKRMTGIWRSKAAPLYSIQQEKELIKIAQELVFGKVVDDGGSVV